MSVLQPQVQGSEGLVSDGTASDLPTTSLLSGLKPRQQTSLMRMRSQHGQRRQVVPVPALRPLPTPRHPVRAPQRTDRRRRPRPQQLNHNNRAATLDHIKAQQVVSHQLQHRQAVVVTDHVGQCKRQTVNQHRKPQHVRPKAPARRSKIAVKVKQPRVWRAVIRVAQAANKAAAPAPASASASVPAATAGTTVAAKPPAPADTAAPAPRVHALTPASTAGPAPNVPAPAPADSAAPAARVSAPAPVGMTAPAPRVPAAAPVGMSAAVHSTTRAAAAVLPSPACRLLRAQAAAGRRPLSLTGRHEALLASWLVAVGCST